MDQLQIGGPLASSSLSSLWEFLRSMLSIRR
uniref:Uncharacterized protein n=1 Tax=Arundo donax TaxID=35708 RepID=A0A0A9GW63_ARUDO